MLTSLVRQGSANVYGCEVGDAVVVLWDSRYKTPILYNKGPYLHFLHADSIDALELANPVDPFLARVVQREFCLVRKVTQNFFSTSWKKITRNERIFIGYQLNYWWKCILSAFLLRAGREPVQSTQGNKFLPSQSREADNQ